MSDSQLLQESTNVRRALLIALALTPVAVLPLMFDSAAPLFSPIFLAGVSGFLVLITWLASRRVFTGAARYSVLQENSQGVAIWIGPAFMIAMGLALLALFYTAPNAGPVWLVVLGLVAESLLFLCLAWAIYRLGHVKKSRQSLAG